MASLAQEWLQAAKSDLNVVEKIVDDAMLTHMVAFHAQQAIEKSLKALLEHYGKNVGKIHKLQTLFAHCKLSYDTYEEEILLLDELYIDSRYPTSFGLLPQGKPTLQQAKRFYEIAQIIYDQIKSIIDG